MIDDNNVAFASSVSRTKNSNPTEFKHGAEARR